MGLFQREAREAEMNVTPELVKLVNDSKCFACGAYPYEDCKRAPKADCGRQFYGGTPNGKKQRRSPFGITKNPLR